MAMVMMAHKKRCRERSVLTHIASKVVNQRCLCIPNAMASENGSMSVHCVAILGRERALLAFIVQCLLVHFRQGL